MIDFFWQGLLHPLLMPAHLMVLIAAGLLAGQQGQTQLIRALAVFCGTIGLSLGLTLWLRLRWEFDVGLLCLALVLGWLIVWRTTLPTVLLLAALVFAGLLIGLDSAAPRIPGLRGTKVYALLVGSALSASALVAVCGVIGLLLRAVLEGIPLRVLGAWITAGALMVLALQMTQT